MADAEAVRRPLNQAGNAAAAMASGAPDNDVSINSAAAHKFHTQERNFEQARSQRGRPQIRRRRSDASRAPRSDPGERDKPDSILPIPR